MRWLRRSALALLLLLTAATLAPFGIADEPATPRRGLLEVALESLNMRAAAKLKEAELLENSGRLPEALAAVREVDVLYRDGMAQIARLLASQTIQEPTPVKKELTAEVSEDEFMGEPARVPEDILPDPGFTRPGGAFRSRSWANGAERLRAPAVLDGLRWLAAHQAADGAWECEGFAKWCDGKVNTGEKPDGPGKSAYDVGVTGLALCALLAAGYTNRGDHEFAKVVRKGLSYLRNVQDPEGCFGPRSTQHYLYNHACAALAMVEAYGMTESNLYKGPAQKALDFLALARNPYFVWRYGVKPGDNDTSTTGWCVTALASARAINVEALERGLRAPFVIDEQAFHGALAWLDKMTDPATGRVGYFTRGSGPARPNEMIARYPPARSESMTAVGAFLRILAGQTPATSEPLTRGVTLLRALPPTWNTTDGSIDMYYWSYGLLAMFQVGGDDWNVWRDALTNVIVAHQRRDGVYCGFKGSWDPVDPWSPDGGRVYSTALMTLACTVESRYVRMFGSR